MSGDLGSDVVLHHGDALVVLPTLPDASVDAVVTDPPYACVDRPYGYWTEEEWFALMKPVVRECRRILKPHGSAVFIIQPNSEKVGRMRPWVWDFLAWACREWNVVQDHYWWNHAAPPTVHTHRTRGLMRPSVKMDVWLGDPDCYRNQDEVLLPAADATKSDKRTDRHELNRYPSGQTMRKGRALQAFRDRGGVTPFNLLVYSNSDSVSSAGAEGHGAGTPEPLCDWWIRYLTHPGDTVLDPFCGTGTTGRAALRLRRKFIGIEQVAEYHAIAERLLAEPPMPLFDAIGEPDVPRQTSMFQGL